MIQVLCVKRFWLNTRNLDWFPHTRDLSAELWILGWFHKGHCIC